MVQLASIATLLLCCCTKNVTGRVIDHLPSHLKASEPLTLPSVNTGKSAQLESLQPRDAVTRSTEWHKYKKNGTENMLYLGLLQGKSKQNPMPDDMPEDLPMLTEDILACSDWGIRYRELEEPDGLEKAYLNLLGMPAQLQPGCREIMHMDASHDSWQDPETPRIFYENIYCPTNGGIVAERNHKIWKDDTAKISWAEAVFSAWFTECKYTGVPVTGLQWVRRQTVTNDITLRLIEEMRKVHQPARRSVDGRVFEVYTLTSKDDDFFALFASPNGNGVYYLLRDNMRALKKSLQAIDVIYAWEENEKTGEGSWDEPNMVLRF